MARGRELSQLGSLITVDDSTKNIGVGIATPSQKIGIGTLSPTSKVEVVGDVFISGIITATSYSGDGSGLSNVPGSAFSNLSEDTSPQLGGDLDVNGNNITGTGNINVSGIVTATSFTGDITGNVTGNTSGSSGSCTGNAATATILQTARTIAGVSFDGSSNISLNNNAITNGAGYITTSHAFTNTNQLTNGAGFITSSGTAALAEGLTGTPDITVGVITATSFSGDGSSLTNISVSSATLSVASRSGSVNVSVSAGIVTVFGRSSDTEVSVAF